LIAFSVGKCYIKDTSNKGGKIINLGNSLFNARKNKGLPQEAVAEKLGVSRQTISKWETDETLPDIRQSKRLAVLYGLSLDELIEFDIDVKEIQEVIDRTSGETTDKINRTKVWGKKYPVLVRYRKEFETEYYNIELIRLLDNLRKKYGYDELDAFLVLKDILAALWKNRKKKQD
jgi:transcriptional regulator with XRE-family HTH domain